MSPATNMFRGEIPDIYDRCLVPLIFESYADDLARRVAATQPGAVLETAAGSGVVTRALAPLLAPEARYVVTDLSPQMLERARGQQNEHARIDWRQADALDLPFEDDSFDAICCQFGAMFFPDKAAGYRAARRCLRPEGAFFFNVWDRIEENEFAHSVTQTLVGLFPDDPPMFMARIPHGYHDTDVIAADLRKAGFTDFGIDKVTAESRAESAMHAAFAFCQGTPLRTQLEALGALGITEITERAAEDIAARFGSGPVAAKMQGFVITARK